MYTKATPGRLASAGQGSPRTECTRSVSRTDERQTGATHPGPGEGSAGRDEEPGPGGAIRALADGGGRDGGRLDIGDLNGDGVLDVVSANYADKTISVLKGKGDGSFWPAIHYEARGPVFSVAVGNLNGDGRPDAALANERTSSGDYPHIQIYHGTPLGALKERGFYEVGMPNRVSIGDLDGDGIADLAVANSFDNAVWFLAGTGYGRFRDPLQFGAGNQPATLAIGELNGDGRMDVATAGVANVAVLFNTGACLDMDRDGCGSVGTGFCPEPGWDCGDEDPAVHPGVAENCDNGADDDCDLCGDENDPDCGTTPWGASRPAEASMPVSGQGTASIPINLLATGLLSAGMIVYIRKRRRD